MRAVILGRGHLCAWVSLHVARDVISDGRSCPWDAVGTEKRLGITVVKEMMSDILVDRPGRVWWMEKWRSVGISMYTAFS